MVDYLSPILAGEDSLPVDPTTDPAPGYDADQRDKPGGFTADPDVMDTWATSSLSPQIATGWIDDPDLFARTFPMDLRPQAHDIIRTWLFYTVVRSHYEHDTVPWSNAAISGFIVDPDRKKLSKSAANAPDDPARAPRQVRRRRRALLGRQRPPGHGRRVRRGPAQDRPQAGHQAAQRLEVRARPRVDHGRARSPSRSTASMLAALADLVAEATAAFDRYDYARAIERTEGFFWSFCDDYLELVKNRAYGAEGDAGAASARTALGLALRTLLGLFAPFLPFVTEEVWSWWQDGSVHRSPWPSADALREAAGADDAASAGEEPDPAVLAVAAAVLGEVRGAKSQAKRSMRTEVTSAAVTDTPERLALLALAEADVRSAGRIGTLTTAPGDTLAVAVELAPEG